MRLCLIIALATPAKAILAQQATPPAPAAPVKPAEAPSPAKPLPSATETPAVVVDNNQAQTLLGKPVRTAKGEDLGRVVDVIVDRGGVVQAAIIDFGGFLGVGSRKIAVDWHILHFPDSGPPDRLIADLPREQLRKAPVYKEGEPIVIMGRTAPAPPAAPAPAAPPAVAPPAAAPASPSPAPAPPPDTPAPPPKTEQPTPKP
ncbi:MAG: PRC-barrel domain-containing protein [Proteobacteria bacterium]|nr:PRC-barrel domain-containing protein [Pseudomonadota bacterium]